MRAPEPPPPGRVPASAVPGIKRVRFLPTESEATLVNISTSGLLAESSTRLQVSSEVTVLFEGGFTPESTSGRVVRCEVAAMGRDGQLWYHIAIEFDSPLPFDRSAQTPSPAPLSSDASTAATRTGREVRNRW